MKLTRKKALEICIELWTWLAETGKEYKDDWEGWKKYGEMDLDCPLCEFSDEHCNKCPIAESKWIGCYAMGYEEWADAETNAQRKKYAKIFLERLLEIK